MVSAARNRRGKRPISEFHVLLAALGDHGPRVVSEARISLRLVGGGAEHAHRMIVREQTYLIGLSVTLRTRSMTGAAIAGVAWASIDHDAVVADDDAAVGIALGREGVEVAADLVEGDLLLGHVAGGGKIRAHRRPRWAFPFPYP